MSGETETTPEKKPRVALLLATGFGLGYLPVAPGTWGSLAGVAIGWFLANFWIFLAKLVEALMGQPYSGIGMSLTLWRLPYAVGTSFFAVVGLWAAHRAGIHFQKNDPEEVVVDEISGQMITYLPVFWTAFHSGGGWKYVVLGFILFRVFDIWKPWPIRRLEKLPGGWGIMADDWLAGVYAAVVLWVVRWQGWIG